jgi:hypothetical protein
MGVRELQRGAVRRVGVLLALTVGLGTATVLAVQAPEYDVKAAFLYNFAKFVEWPASTFAGPAAPIRICVVGSNPFGGHLQAFTRGKQVNGRTIAVRTGVPIASARSCQMVFVSPSERGRTEAILAQLAGRPVLTVGDTADFADQGGIIGLSMDESHVRFQINMVAARRAKLKLSSQVLKVATQVIGQLDEGK